jgi:F0F1-type ATP synthase membrane subunit b/b'
VLVIIVVAVLTVLVLQFNTRLRSLTYPIYDKAAQEAERRAETILRDAREQARMLKTKAEMDAGAILAERKREIESLRNQYTSQLEIVAQEAKRSLESHERGLEELSKTLSAELSTQREVIRDTLKKEAGAVTAALGAEQEELKREFSVLRERLQASNEEFLEQNKRNITEVISGELETARKAIADYRERQLNFVDEQIVVLIETVARVALNRALSLTEHANVITSALEDAKRQGVFKL